MTYNTPVNEVGGVSYYDGNINGTITINEANFDSQDVSVTYSMNGSDAGTLPVSWSDNSVDEHIGTFTLTSDGDYIVRISYTDKSSNAMEVYTSNQMTIDTKIEKPTYTINGTPKTENGGAYKDEANIGFSYSDQNFSTRKITLKESNDYDFIVVDADSKYDEDTAGLLNLASKVIIVTNQNEASIFSTNVLISNLNGINSDKYIFICNDFSNERDNALVSPNIKPNFTVSEYVEHLEHYDKVRIKDLEKVSGIQKVTFLLI